jgi:hypothetical protein
MALNATTVASGGKITPPLDPGVYPGRLVQVIDLGLQTQRPFPGDDKPKAPIQELYLTFEMSDAFLLGDDGEEMEDKPRFLSKSFPFHNISSDKATSTLFYKALDPTMSKGGEWKDLLGTPANITVVQNPGKGKNVGRVYNNIAGIAPMRPKDAAKLPPLVNEPLSFDLDAPDLSVFNKLPDFVKNRIKENLNYAGSALASMLGEATSANKPTEAVAPVDLDDNEPPY